MIFAEEPALLQCSEGEYLAGRTAYHRQMGRSSDTGCFRLVVWAGYRMMTLAPPFLVGLALALFCFSCLVRLYAPSRDSSVYWLIAKMSP